MSKLFLIYFLSSGVFAQTYFAGKTPDQIVELKKKATLKMEIINEKNKVINTFVGFFIEKNGRFATVHHSFQDDFKFEKGKVQIAVRDGSGNEFKDVIIEGCSNKNNIDICTGLIKNHNPKYYFNFSTTDRRVGELFSSIGHCKDDQLAPFTHKKGEVSKVTSNYQSAYSAVGDIINLNTKLFEVNLPKCVGDSGGPLFDQFSGALLGMYSFAYKNHYFAIDSSEIKKIFDENLNKVQYEVPTDRIFVTDPCTKAKKGTREYENCLTFQ